jgi:steroid delta-isomerase-like uncharacterized protein
VDDEVTALVVRFYEQLWNRWDDSAVEYTLAEGFTFRGSLGVQTTGRAGWRAYRDLTRGYAPDFHNEIVSLVSSGGQAAARLLFTGTHQGPVLGFPPTGRPFSYSGAAFFTATDGLLTDAWVLGDLDTLRTHLAGNGTADPVTG